MKLQQRSYEWALQHLLTEGDSDLFPTPFEFEAMKHCWDELVKELIDLNVEQYQWSPGRRFVIPKESLAFRTATQLDPFDSLILTALTYESGKRIEAYRIPTADEVVFSCRFSPQPDGRLYGRNSNWDGFWRAGLEKASNSNVTHVLIADIADCYNQIYHHVVDNELHAANVPHQARFAFTRMLAALTQTVSRGLPVGPHSSRLLAEIALNPIDRRLAGVALKELSPLFEQMHIEVGRPSIRPDPFVEGVLADGAVYGALRADVL